MVDPQYDASKISVCLLNYNHAHLIESTVDSILVQDCGRFEFIISDDCSTDDSWERIQALAKRNRQIVPLRTPHNLRMPGNANFAVAQSTRTYIALLHHDDIYRPDLLRRWAQCLDKHPEAAFVFNAYGVHGSTFTCNHPHHPPNTGVFNGRWFLNCHLLPIWGCPVRGTAMIRRDCWDAVDGMDERFDLLADVDLWMRLAARYDIGYVAEPLIYVRHQRPDNYPETYTGLGSFWQRQRFLYHIHAANRRALYTKNLIGDQYKWLLFRARLSAETIKWLGYAVVQKKYNMLTTSYLGSVPEEFFIVRWLRALLVKLFSRHSTPSL